MVLEGIGPTPFISMLLSDMGADVVRVARPRHRSAREIGQTKGLSPDRDVVNRGTTAVEVDLKDPAGIESRAAPGRLGGRLHGGLPAGRRRAARSRPRRRAGHAIRRIVFARITGYGQTGRTGDRRRTRHQLRRPVRRPAHPRARPGERAASRRSTTSVTTPAAGRMGAFGIVCALSRGRALRARAGRRRGDGRRRRAAHRTNAGPARRRACSPTSPGPTTSTTAHRSTTPTGARTGGSWRWARSKPTSTGSSSPARAPTPTTWPDRDDEANWPQLRTLIEDRIGDQVDGRVGRRSSTGTDACVTPVLNFPEAARDPHNAERGVFVDVDGVLQPAPSPRLDRTPARRPGLSAREGADVGDVAARWSETSARARLGSLTPPKGRPHALHL